MKVAIFGATGLVGKSTLQCALEEGHQVSVLVRNAQKVNIEHSNLKIVEGNVLVQSTVSQFLKDQEAVIQTLGYGGNPKKPTTLTTDATKIIVKGMRENGIKRLIAISVVGVGNSKSFKYPFLVNLIFPLVMMLLKHVIDDKNQMEPVITNSQLDWTIVRSSAVADKPASGKPNVTLDGKGLKLSMNVKNLAAFLVDQVSDSNFIGKAPVISD